MEKLPLDRWVRSALEARKLAEELVDAAEGVKADHGRPPLTPAEREEKIAGAVEILIGDESEFPQDLRQASSPAGPVVPLSASRKAVLRQFRENRRLNKSMPPPRSKSRRGEAQ